MPDLLKEAKERDEEFVEKQHSVLVPSFWLLLLLIFDNPRSQMMTADYIETMASYIPINDKVLKIVY